MIQMSGGIKSSLDEAKYGHLFCWTQPCVRAVKTFTGACCFPPSAKANTCGLWNIFSCCIICCPNIGDTVKEVFYKTKQKKEIKNVKKGKQCYRVHKCRLPWCCTWFTLKWERWPGMLMKNFSTAHLSYNKTTLHSLLISYIYSI